MTTIKRRSADMLVTAIHSFARLFGERFYELFLDRIGRELNAFNSIVDVRLSKDRIRLFCPNRKSHWRVATYFTKEPSTLEWIDGFAPQSILWDVGANIGLYSLYAAARGHRVLSFEPIPANYQVLCENVRLNRFGDRIWPFAVALDARTCLGRLSMGESDAGSAFSSFSERADEQNGSIAMQGFAIDDFMEMFSPPFPQHLKIDVDGIEDKVLGGASRTLRDTRLLSITIEGDHDKPEKLSAIHKKLGQAGFELSGEFRSPLYPGSPFANLRFFRKSK